MQHVTGLVSISFRAHAPREILCAMRDAGLSLIEWGSDVHAPCHDLARIDELVALQREFGFTIIFVTHDQSEAMAISDRMMVCDMGKIMQIDTPENLYNKPINRFVHNFLGESTFINVDVREGKVYPKGDGSQAMQLDIPADAAPEMVVATRPNEIELLASTESGYKTKIAKRIFLTDRTEYLVPVGEQMVKIQTPHRVRFAQGDECVVRFVDPMWYPMDDEEAEKERAKRQLF